MQIGEHTLKKRSEIQAIGFKGRTTDDPATGDPRTITQRPMILCQSKLFPDEEKKEFRAWNFGFF